MSRDPPEANGAHRNGTPDRPRGTTNLENHLGRRSLGGGGSELTGAPVLCAQSVPQSDFDCFMKEFGDSSGLVYQDFPMDFCGLVCELVRLCGPQQYD